jgi:hypothetical protein
VLAKLLDPNSIAGVIRSVEDPSVAPLFDVDAAELELACFRVSGISMPFPF